MRSRYRPTPAETALLTVYLIHAYAREKAKEVTRARISRKTLRILAVRKPLRQPFIDDWVTELADLGWSAWEDGDNFALLRTDTIEGWARISARRISDTMERVRNGDPDVFDEIAGKINITDDNTDDE